MNKYKVGDKVVMKIISADQDEIKKYSVSGVDNNWSWCLPQNLLERYTEPLSTYTEPLEAKIRRQAAEITRLLAENERLKPNYENIRAVGQNEAWELARKIASTAGGLSSSELVEIFNAFLPRDILSENTYPEAAAKVSEWKKAKEEIKVGDVVKAVKTECDEIVEFCVTEIDDEGFIYGVGAKGQIFSGRPKHLWHKTGRHIDIDSLLKQLAEE